MSGLFYDREGRPITLEEWAGLLRDQTYKRVAESNVGDLWVSTVWVGIDDYTGSKLIYETMVFRVGTEIGEPVEGPVRYATYGAAKAGHDWMVKELKRRQRFE